MRYVKGSRVAPNPVTPRFDHASLWPLLEEEFSELKYYYEKQYSCKDWGTVFVMRRLWSPWWWVPPWI